MYLKMADRARRGETLGVKVYWTVSPGATGRPANHLVEIPRSIERRLLPVATAVRLCVWWLLAFVLAVWLEPGGTSSPATIVDWALGLLLFSAMALFVALCVVRSPAAFTAGVVLGLAMSLSIVACVATGHHQIGVWWFAQLAVMAATTVATADARRLAVVGQFESSRSIGSVKGIIE